MNSLKYIAISLLCMGSMAAFAQVKLSPLFSDNMVLQQQSQVPVWGETKPGKTVTIKTSWDGKEYTVRAYADGKWETIVATPKAGGPYTIRISDGKPVTLENVMIGEVWLCSGQSNMEMQVEDWGKVMNYEQEKAEANQYPNIRFLLVEKATSSQPIDELKAAAGGWQVCSSKSVADFSAAAYFFGRDLHQNLDVPIGLIDTSWGGTYAESWTSRPALSTLPYMRDRLQQAADLPVTKEGREEKFRQDVAAWSADVAKKDKGYADGKAVWASADFDDADWQQMRMPGWIQEQGLPGFNGIVWFRKTIDIPARWAGKELTLEFGSVDDNDFTYFNGVEVGHTENWMAPRSYKISKELVKAGKVVIAVRVMDTGGNGGFGGDARSMVLRRSEKDALALAGDWKYQPSLSLRDVPPMPLNTANEPNIPSFLFNAMLNPLVPYCIKGAIWYQGEANTGDAYRYRDLLPLMITDWRNQWGYEFPFYIVQLANFMAQQPEPSESAWAELREAQARALHLNNTGLAVAIDIGDAFDIHPKNKQEVGRRLALQARARTYGEKIPFSSPMYKSYRIEGNKIRLTFSHTYGLLKAKDGGKLQGFAIAGPDHKFHWADAVVEGKTIVVSSPEVPMPLAVRYAWADNPACNVYNKADLPLAPFRTDDWKGVTRGNE